MNFDRLIICGVDEVSNYCRHNITHIVSIVNPGTSPVETEWFSGERLVLYFGDVVSAADAAQFHTQAPTLEDLRMAVEFISQAWQKETAKVLVQCDYGASRSPALAYVALANDFGPGHEEEAFRTTLECQPDAVPNLLVVQLGDVLLKRQGSLTIPLKKMNHALNEEINQLLP